jgi:hypothetical protein
MMFQLICDYDNETWRWYSKTSGYFGPEFFSEHEARLWLSKETSSF